MAWTYLLTIVLLLALPAVGMTWWLASELHRRAYVMALVMITALGWTWSALLSAQGWWSFSLDYASGLTLGPHLLIEEACFYAPGGAMCLLLYTLGARRPMSPRPRLFASISVGGTLLAFAVTAAAWSVRPWYFVSMIALYNLMVTLPLLPWVAPRIHIGGWALSVLGMSTIGYVWDVLCVRYGWWTYDAGTGWLLGGAPLDDFDFFLFAPTAAISLYLAAQAATRGGWSVAPPSTELP